MKRFGALAIGLKKMKPRKLFYKLFPTYFLISLVGLVVLVQISRFAFKNFYYKEISNNLIQKAKIIEDDITKLLMAKKFLTLQKEIKLLSLKSENRISVILPSGKIIADSSYNASKMENHKDRQEVAQALDGKTGHSIRFSLTSKKKQLFIALPLSDGTQIIGILRNSVPINQLQTSLYLLTKNIMYWSFVLLLMLTYFIYFQAKKISLPLEEMRKQVDHFSGGNFQHQIEMRETATEEISSLYSAIHKMSTELQTQLQKINKQKNEQLAVFTSMLEGVITIHPDMTIYHINKAALDLFNYIPGEIPIKGTPLKEVVKSERIFSMTETLFEDHKNIVNEFEYKSGIVLNVHGTILRSDETGMLGAVLVFNDITKMRELESHRKQFVANVSHELKTPLTAILGYLETIMDGDIDDKATLNKFLDIIHKHSKRLKTIIEDLLSLSSIERESEIGGLKLEQLNIIPVIENAISLCQDKAKSKGVNIILEGANELAKINLPLLEQAIINLIDNAIKYGPQDSTVNVSLSKNDKTLSITVIDKGSGIPQQHHDRLFERFYSVDKARSRELGGSGLGLSIVKHIALSHGGNVRVESKINHGSSFIFELPL